MLHYTSSSIRERDRERESESANMDTKAATGSYGSSSSFSSSMECYPAQESKLTTVINIKGGSRVPDSDKFYRKSEKICGVKLQYCTEELGSESRPSSPLSDEKEEEKQEVEEKEAEEEDEKVEAGEVEEEECAGGQLMAPPPAVDCYPRRQKIPPPLTILVDRAGYNHSSKRRTLKKRRENGRFVLWWAPEDPTCEYLRADRSKDGHLKLHLAPPKKNKADSELEAPIIVATPADNSDLTTHRTSDDSVPMPSEIIKQMEFLDPPTPPSLPSSGRLNNRQRVAIQEGLQDYLAKLKKRGVLGGNNSSGFCKSGLGRDKIRDYCYWEVHSCVATSS